MARPAIDARILTEAGPAVGLGHLTRCVAFCDALEALGCACELVVAGEAPAHVVGDRAVRLAEWRTPAAVAQALTGAEIAVVDSYVAGPEVYAVVAEMTGAAAYLDDTARLPYPRGFVVNGNPEAASLAWPQQMEATRLLGIEYQLLRAEFTGAPERTVRARAERVLVVAGGTDVGGARRALAAAARAAIRDAEIDLVDAPRTAAELRDAMLAADVAVSAAGQTLYELAATGTPAVAVTVADNQLPQARALERAGAVLLAGAWGEAGTLEAVTRHVGALEDPAAREARTHAARALVDGKGAERVARLLVGEALGQRVELCLAVERDEQALLELANDPIVRGASFSQGLVSPAEHHEWFEGRLSDPECVLLLAWDAERLAGYVRFDIDDGEAVVSIAVSQEYRGFHLAGGFLERAIAVVRADRPDVRGLLAYVRAENAASRALFERLGFSAQRDAESLPADATLYRRTL